MNGMNVCVHDAWSERWVLAWTVAVAVVAGCAASTTTGGSGGVEVAEVGSGGEVAEVQVPRPADPADELDAALAARGERLQPPGQDPPRPGGRCVEAQNAQGTLSTNCGGASLAWQYIPTTSFRLEQVDLYTHADAFALLDDAGGRPGGVLSRGTFARGNEPGWESARLDPPVELEAGRTYWLWKTEGTCSIVESGARPVYWANLRGLDPSSWQGPFRGHAFTARLYGTCL
jgi:hypothetical protein